MDKVNPNPVLNNYQLNNKEIIINSSAYYEMF